MRTFIAAPIEQTPALRRLHEGLTELGDRFRPVALGTLHVTLKFLGETAQTQLAEICTITKRIVEKQPRVFGKLTGLGAFPHARRPAVVWVGIEEAQPLCRIADDLDHELSKLGFAAEGKAFQPHVTLLRVKSRPPEALAMILAEEARTDFGACRIDKIELMQSEPSRSGSRYTTLATFRMSGVLPV
jgi:2'-5' RNA ligase